MGPLGRAFRSAPRAGGPEGVELADLFCRQARVRVEALFATLWENTDALDSTAAQRILDGRYAFLETGVVTPAADAPWVAPWEPGPSSAPDARRRVPPPPDGGPPPT